MNFKNTFELLIRSFDSKRLKYALIGGFALESAGVVRATMDIDLLILARDKRTITDLMVSNGYSLLHKSDDVMNFTAQDQDLGRVDFILAHRKYTLAMLERAKRKHILGGQTEISVVEPEDLIGLKVQAMANDPERYTRDLVDIGMILKKNAGQLDYDRVQVYFRLFDMVDVYRKLTDAQ